MADRPLSPHLQIYRPQLTSVLSFMHRFTGACVAIGTLLLVWWLAAAAAGPEHFAFVQAFIGSFIGRLLLFGWTVTLFYHICNGIRHLAWDAGYGYGIDATYRSGRAVVVATVALTLLAWVIGYAAGGWL